MKEACRWLGTTKMPQFTMDMNPKLDKVLAELSEMKEVPKSEIIRRAVGYYSLLEEERQAGKKITLCGREEQDASRDFAALCHLSKDCVRALQRPSKRLLE